MGKLVKFKFTDGSFDQGFSVEIEIGEDGQTLSIAKKGKLPPTLEIPHLYDLWQKAYYKLGFCARIQAVQGQVTNVSIIKDCNQAADRLCMGLKSWLGSSSFSSIREAFIKNIHDGDEVRILLQTENDLLQKLPWHRWDLIDNHSNAEIAICPHEYQKVEPPSQDTMRILAIFGSSKGIDIKTDQNLISKLPNAELVTLLKPTREELNDALWHQNWSIIFFAGHSDSELDGSLGRIYINDSDSEGLSLEHLSKGLRRAIKYGLKLAIFNSCDGIGLARSLFELYIPQVIVMRERVPDRVAQEFLKNFLTDFAAGTSLYQSVRRAREKLQGLEDRFPCATWLPIICQNPAETPLAWPKPVVVEPEPVVVEPEPVVVVEPEPIVVVEPEPIVVVEPEPIVVEPKPKLNKLFLILKSLLVKRNLNKLFPILVLLLLLAGGTYGWRRLAENCKLPFQTSGCSTLLAPSIEDRMSFGEKIMPLPIRITPQKKAGIAAFAAGNYAQAAIEFEASLRSERDDPETLIYLTNARIGSQKSYTIAVTVPIRSEDPNKAVGNPYNAVEMLRGFAQAQHEINQSGGINGVPLRLVIINDEDRPDIAKQIAIALAQKHEVLAVVGHWTSDVILTVAPVYDSEKLVFITPISTVAKLSNLSPYVFRTNITTVTGARVLVDYMKDNLRKQKVAIFFTSKATYSREYKDNFRAAVASRGGQVVKEIDMSDPSFTAAKGVSEAMEHGAEVILLATNNEFVEKSLEVIVINNGRLAILGDLANMYGIKTLKIGGESAVGMVMAVSWHILQEDRLKVDPKSSKDPWSSNVNWVPSFSKRSRDLWGGDVNWVTANSYNSLEALITALKRNPNPTRMGIQQALSSPDLNVPGTSGPFNFLPSGDVDLPVLLIKVIKANPSRSGTGYDFVPIFAK
jgi:branched-chain amino acid transport system substrate-binding protein